MGQTLFGDRVRNAPRICLSPDHIESKDNMAIAFLQNQAALDQIDPVSMFADVADGARFLFVGSWSQPVPTWFSSIQAVFGAHYSQAIPGFLSKQIQNWNQLAESLERGGSFLVADDVGRLTGLTGISRSWRSRVTRSGPVSEPKSASWFAAMVDLPMALSEKSVEMRVHRLNVIEPDSWCGSPKIDQELLNQMALPKDCSEIWISAPSVGVTLWLGEQLNPLSELLPKLCAPSAILGWHPIRDFLIFLSRARNGSMFYMVDRHSRLQVLKKDGGVL
jgi:hypothetical protein